MIDRLAYITVAELNEILFATFEDNDETKRLIIEASEVINHFTLSKITDGSMTDNIKIATAYQVEYNSINDGLDDEYAVDGASHNLGNYSTSTGSSGLGVSEFKKLSPKSHRILMTYGLLYKGL